MQGLLESPAHQQLLSELLSPAWGLAPACAGRPEPLPPVVAVVEDNGAGFEVAEVENERHLGMLGMRERAELLGG